MKDSFLARPRKESEWSPIFTDFLALSPCLELAKEGEGGFRWEVHRPSTFSQGLNLDRGLIRYKWQTSWYSEELKVAFFASPVQDSTRTCLLGLFTRRFLLNQRRICQRSRPLFQLWLGRRKSIVLLLYLDEMRMESHFVFFGLLYDGPRKLLLLSIANWARKICHF